MFKRIVNITFMFFTLSLAELAQSADDAVDIVIEDDIISLSLCRTYPDAEESTNFQICCSKSMGVCVDCRDAECAITTYPNSKPAVDRLLQKKSATGQGSVQVLPKSPTLRDQLKQPKRATTAPEKEKLVSPKNPKPTVKAIKQHKLPKAAL